MKVYSPQVEYYLYKMWWFAVYFGMGAPRRMKMLDDEKEKYASLT